MAKEAINPVSTFFPSPNQVTNRKAQGALDPAFAQQLDKKADAPLMLSAETSKIDKPKLYNREPFFPKTPMPYHPDPEVPVVVVQNPKAQPDVTSAASTPTSVVETTGSPSDFETDPYSEMYAPAPEDFKAVTPTMGNPAGVGRLVTMSSVPNGNLGEDTAGVMAESFDGSIANYPVKQIASESLDEEAIASLKEKQLWNRQPILVAAPSQNIIPMIQTVEAKPKFEGPVPKPIAQFMASLESELGVSPERLAQAIRQLPDGQLQLKPEQTMVQVVKNLNLKPADETRALELYSKMLAKMEILNENQKMPMPFPGAFEGLKDKDLQKSLKVKGESHDGKSEKYIPMAVAGATGKGFAPQTEGQMAQSDLNQNAMSEKNTPTPSAFAKSQAPSSESQKLSYSQPAAKVDVKKDMKTEIREKATKMDLSAAPLAGLEAFKSAEATPVTTSSAPTTQGLEDSARQEAIKSVINNAQLLAQKGGGEMKMTLKPDNLGEIQLRVAMQDNRVDVQMVTERAEVKKLMEQNIHELRNGLAQHSLSMDKLDVSVNDKNTGQFNQRQPDFAQARDFANQFHQQSQNRRENFMDFGGPMTMRRPMFSQSAVTATASPRLGVSSGRLNVMA